MKVTADANRCECADPGCPIHKGSEHCAKRATELLFRTDMDDETGVAFCAKCADDAMDSGVFTPDEPQE